MTSNDHKMVLLHSGGQDACENLNLRKPSKDSRVCLKIGSWREMRGRKRPADYTCTLSLKFMFTMLVLMLLLLPLVAAVY